MNVITAVHLLAYFSHILYGNLAKSTVHASNAGISNEILNFLNLEFHDIYIKAVFFLFLDLRDHLHVNLIKIKIID